MTFFRQPCSRHAPRGAPPQTLSCGHNAGTARPVSAAMLIAAVYPAGAPIAHMFVCHRQPAFRTQLSPLAHHTGGNLRHVRNKVRTKPHGVTGAGLARFVAGLRGRSGYAESANCHNPKTYRQCRTADNTNKRQHVLAPWFSMGHSPTANLKHEPENASPDAAEEAGGCRLAAKRLISRPRQSPF
jgi:hypothetical protein